MKPGATTRPLASITRAAFSGATILPRAMPMSSRRAGAPVPSTTMPLRIAMSQVMRAPSEASLGARRLALRRGALRLQRALVLLHRRLERGLVLLQHHAHLAHLLAGLDLELREPHLRPGKAFPGGSAHLGRISGHRYLPLG